MAYSLGTTRGTMAQTLKARERKGTVTKHRSGIDKRSISYSLTKDGRNRAAHTGGLDDARNTLDDAEQARPLLPAEITQIRDEQVPA